jgi:hypothetical protein
MATLIAKDECGHLVTAHEAIQEIFMEGVAFGRLEQRMHDGEDTITWTIRTGRENRIYSMAEIFNYTICKSQEDIFGSIYQFNKIKD